jgi:hypothetical protein
MDKEIIINMLEDTDIKNVLGIDIQLELENKDCVSIHYMNVNGEYKNMKKYINNSTRR